MRSSDRYRRGKAICLKAVRHHRGCMCGDGVMRGEVLGRGIIIELRLFFFFSSRRRHTRCSRDWSSDVCSSDLLVDAGGQAGDGGNRVFGESQLHALGFEERGILLDKRVLRLGQNSYEILFLEGLQLHANGQASLRSEEHTSELQSRLHLACRLLLEKK